MTIAAFLILESGLILDLGWPPNACCRFLSMAGLVHCLLILLLVGLQKHLVSVWCVELLKKRKEPASVGWLFMLKFASNYFEFRFLMKNLKNTLHVLWIMNALVTGMRLPSSVSPFLVCRLNILM